MGVIVSGFCDHESFAAVGMAVPDRANLFRMQAMRGMGGNARRTSHNPPAPSLMAMTGAGTLRIRDQRDDVGPAPLAPPVPLLPSSLCSTMAIFVSSLLPGGVLPSSVPTPVPFP